MRVVIVDDDKEILEMLERAFKLETNYKIFLFDNPVKAFDFIVNEKVDVLITDIQMPEMSGLDLIKKVKTTNGMIQIITITAYTKFDYVMTALRRGSYEIFLKPFENVNNLINCVKELEIKINRWKEIIVKITRKN